MRRRRAHRPDGLAGIIRRFVRNRRGNAALEFGFAAPIALLLLLGAVDAGRAVAMQATLDHAAREGARYAAVHGADSLIPRSEAEVTAFVRDRMTWLDTAAVSVSVTYAPDASAGSTVSIQIERRFDFMIAQLAGLDPLELVASASMTVL